MNAKELRKYNRLNRRITRRLPVSAAETAWAWSMRPAYLKLTSARYIHRWRTPITVVVYGNPEHWYYAPHYDPRLLPVPVSP